MQLRILLNMAIQVQKENCHHIDQCKHEYDNNQKKEVISIQKVTASEKKTKN